MEFIARHVPMCIFSFCLWYRGYGRDFFLKRDVWKYLRSVFFFSFWIFFFFCFFQKERFTFFVCGWFAGHRSVNFKKWGGRWGHLWLHRRAGCSFTCRRGNYHPQHDGRGICWDDRSSFCWTTTPASSTNSARTGPILRCWSDESHSSASSVYSSR